MTKQEQNEMILEHIDADIKMSPDITKRISLVFNNWFQSLVQAATEPAIQEPLEEEAEPV